MIDLRSDTVTQPTAEMRRAMAEAETGDDVYREDATVNRLEERAAEVAGKEAALFVPTGTMGNSIAIKLHTRHGQEVVCETRSHVFNYELSMMAWVAGCVARPITAPGGILTWNNIRREVRPLGAYQAPTGLIEIENTNNMTGGTVYPLEVIDEICESAHEMGLPVHMDGARVFNAAATLGVPVARITRDVDTVMFCLSKGLGAPVGSMLAGTREAMAEGRLLRKRLGGGMRQAGVIAAAGLVALDSMADRLVVDHENARSLAFRLAEIDGIEIDPAAVETNILIFSVRGTGMDGARFCEELRRRGVLAIPVGPAEVRFVTHYDVDARMCDEALEAVRDIAACVARL